MNDLAPLLAHELGSWTLGQLGLAFLFVLGGFVARAILNLGIRSRLRKLVARTATEADDQLVDALVSPLGLILPVIGFYLAMRLLVGVEAGWTGTADRIFRVVTILLIGWTLFRAVDAVSTLLGELTERTSSRLDDQLVPLLRKAAKTFLAILGFLLVAQNLGYSVSGLLAGLGIGGLALAMAARDTLANFFGSLMILVDRPFHVGDWVTFGDTDGTVEEVGLRSTRIRTFAKTLVSVPNQVVANATIENHSLMPKRRIKFTVGVTYDATVTQMETLVARIEEYLRGNPDIDQEFMLVKFTAFNDSSLDVFVYCFTITTDWTKHLAARQEVNLAIMAVIEEMDLSIAFPTRTVRLIEEAVPESSPDESP